MPAACTTPARGTCRRKEHTRGNSLALPLRECKAADSSGAAAGTRRLQRVLPLRRAATPRPPPWFATASSYPAQWMQCDQRPSAHAAFLASAEIRMSRSRESTSAAARRLERRRIVVVHAAVIGEAPARDVPNQQAEPTGLHAAGGSVARVLSASNV